jgi:hypothetical protein
MSKRVVWVAAMMALALALLTGAHATHADDTSTAILYRSNGTALGLAVITSTGPTAQLKIVLIGAAPSATYSVSQCSPDPLGGTPGCNNTKGTLNTDTSGSGTFTTAYTRGAGMAIIIVTNTALAIDSGQGVLTASPTSVDPCSLAGSIFGIDSGLC